MDFSYLKDLSSNQGNNEINDDSDDSEGSVMNEYEKSSNIKQKTPQSSVKCCWTMYRMYHPLVQDCLSVETTCTLSLVLETMSGSMESDLFWFMIVFANTVLWLCVVNNVDYNK